MESSDGKDASVATLLTSGQNTHPAIRVDQYSRPSGRKTGYADRCPQSRIFGKFGRQNCFRVADKPEITLQVISRTTSHPPREAWGTPAPTRRALYSDCSDVLLFTMMHPEGVLDDRQLTKPMLSIPLDPMPSWMAPVVTL